MTLKEIGMDDERKALMIFVRLRIADELVWCGEYQATFIKIVVTLTIFELPGLYCREGDLVKTGYVTGSWFRLTVSLVESSKLINGCTGPGSPSIRWISEMESSFSIFFMSFLLLKLRT